MLRHIPEGVVPFEESGCGRNPLFPVCDREILLDCLCDEGRAQLEWDREGSPRLKRIEKNGDSWRYVLEGPARPCRLRYRFSSERQSTRWFLLDIHKRITIEQPAAVGASWVQLLPNVYLSFQMGEEGLACRLVEQEPQEDNALSKGEWRLSTGGGVLWALQYGKESRLACTEIILLLRADGSVAYQEMILRGTHQHVYGTGERFDAVDQQGKGTCGQVVEHFTQQKEWSYLPSPMFLTDAGYGFYRDSGCNVSMKFGELIRIASPAAPGMKDTWLLGTPAQQLKSCIRLTGAPELPPEWAFGLWISANGWNNDAEVDEQLRQLKENHCPASVMVLEAWSDESTFYRWSDQWPDAAATVRKIRDAGLHLILWQIPALKALDECPDPQIAAQDRKEALSKGWIVKHADGSPYVIPERWFQGSLLPDFTNPEARRWWFGKREHLLEMGVEGFKTDGGEFLFGSDVCLWDGTDGRAAHNLYPVRYVKAYQDWMKSRGVTGVTFSRAGYAGAQRLPIYWAGDQLSTWQELAAQLTAGLSAGLSGVLFWSFDIGGFAGEMPEKELYLRATAFGCFCPVMQWHAEPRSGQFWATHDAKFNNDRSPWNLAKKHGDPDILRIACDFARIRETLRPYLWEEAQYCVAEGRPLMAHLCLDYPDDLRALACGDEYMLGRRYLVAPIIEQNAAGRKVYLPAGKWRHFFTDDIFSGEAEWEFCCPLTQALVFERLEP